MSEKPAASLSNAEKVKTSVDRYVDAMLGHGDKAKCKADVIAAIDALAASPTAPAAETVSQRYMREQVAKDMQPFYEAFGHSTERTGVQPPVPAPIAWIDQKTLDELRTNPHFALAYQRWLAVGAPDNLSGRTIPLYAAVQPGAPETDKQDAARYRWLKSHGGLKWVQGMDSAAFIDDGAEAAIDSAMRGETGGGS